MAEDRKRTKEARWHEIQSSIAQGKIMLNVLRSLPESESIRAFIIRFEELVARLQKWESQCNQNTCCQPEMGVQFDLLTQKEEHMRSLLEQTTQQLKSTFTGTLDSSGTLQPASENETLRSATEYLSQLQAQLTNESETFEDLAPGSMSSKETVVSASSHQLNSRSIDAGVSSENITDSIVSAMADVVASTPHTTSVSATTLSTRFAIPVAKLDGLIEDSRKFQNMVERLIDITRRAHLTEANSFLVDISARFVDLRNSFNSLKKSYQEVRDDSELPSELRELQLNGFQEFLERLGSNLESTKECFFNIYHLVKSDIEHSVADGSLQTTLSDDEDADGDNEDQLGTGQDTTVLQQSIPRQEQQPDTVSVSVAASDNRQYVPGAKVTDSLASQKAYLTALQNQTASERQEIQRLLQQRDQLAERLAALKATTLLADSLANSGDASSESNDPIIQSDTKELAIRPQTESTDNYHLGPALVGSTENVPSDVLLSSLSLAHQQKSALLSHLESKRRELDQLRTQLSVLRQAEENANTTAATGGTEKQVKEVQQSGRELLKPLGNSGHDTNPPQVTMQCADEDKASDSRLFGRTSNACSQPPTNTEVLYENMREARILLEQQRDFSTSSTNAKALLQRLTGVASVTNSQDRTTLATWGGSSSPVHSSASTMSRGDEDDDNTENSRSAQQIQLAIVSTSSSPLLGFSPIGATTEVSDSKAAGDCQHAISHRHKKLRTLEAISDSDVSGTQQTTNGAQVVNLVALPQLGHSPSPPPTRQKQASGRCDRKLMSESTDLQNSGTDLYVYSHRVPTTSAVTSGGDMPISELTYSLINERMQRMEINIAQLFQACRCLAVENSSLRSTVSQLLVTPACQANNDILTVNPSAPNSGMVTPSGGIRVAPDPPGSMLLVSPYHHQQLQRPGMIQYTGYGMATSQQNSTLPPLGGTNLVTARQAESASGIDVSQMVLLQQQQHLHDLEAQQQQQTLSRLLLQQQPPVPPLQVDRLPRRPLLFQPTGHITNPDLQWPTGSFGQPTTSSLTLSAVRFPSRPMANGFPGSQFVAPPTVGVPDATYNCLLSPQSSQFTGHQAVSGNTAVINAPVGSMLPGVDLTYQMPLPSNALLSKYAGGII